MERIGRLGLLSKRLQAPGPQVCLSRDGLAKFPLGAQARPDHPPRLKRRLHIGEQGARLGGPRPRRGGSAQRVRCVQRIGHNSVGLPRFDGGGNPAKLGCKPG
jgi:hypothetical protein